MGTSYFKTVVNCRARWWKAGKKTKQKNISLFFFGETNVFFSGRFWSRTAADLPPASHISTGISQYIQQHRVPRVGSPRACYGRLQEQYRNFLRLCGALKLHPFPPPKKFLKKTKRYEYKCKNPINNHSHLGQIMI